jgi:hypothetical protein
MARSRSTPRPTNELGTQVPASRFTHPIVFLLDRYPVTSCVRFHTEFLREPSASGIYRNLQGPIYRDPYLPATTLYFRYDPAESEAGFPVRS